LGLQEKTWKGLIFFFSHPLRRKTTWQSFNAFINQYLYVYISILRNQGKALGGHLMHFSPKFEKKLPF